MTRSTRSPFARTATLLAVAALGLGLSGCSLLDQLTGDGTVRDDGGQVVESNDAADVFTIQVGDCLNDADAAEEVTEVPLVPCAEPHDSEVYASIIVTGEEFPGQAAVQEEAETGCRADFESFVGVPYLDSIYDFSYYFPTEASWGGGDREILCVIYDPAGQPVTGTLAGIER